MKLTFAISALLATTTTAFSGSTSAFGIHNIPIATQRPSTRTSTRPSTTTTRSKTNSDSFLAFVPRRIQSSSILNNRKMSSSSSALSAIAGYTIGIIGATGAVGKEIRYVLEKRNQNIPIKQLRIFGSERSAGTIVTSDIFGTIPIELFTVQHAKECDICFIAVSGDFALQYAKELVNGPDGCIVIDNSSAFRRDDDIPLVVPEINGKETKKSKLIANPNCTTAIGLMALWPLHQAFILKKIIMSTYQAASGAGQEGMDELKSGTKQWLENDGIIDIQNKIFAHPLPFNVIPHIDKFQENGYTKEEMKVVWESRKICGLDDDFPISCTAVRIPTIRAHSESIIIETEKPVDITIARDVLSKQSGLKLMDDITQNIYPMPLSCTGSYDVEVGRIRKSLIYNDYGLEFFVCGDQLLRGAALNAVLIAEEMISNGSAVLPTSSSAVETA